MKIAVFLDRDGVLVEDRGVITDAASMRLISGVAAALMRLRVAGFLLILASNQTAVARGLVSEAELAAMNARLDELLRGAGGPPLDAHYVCPHHPEATLERYRVACECRKPRAGLLTQAAAEHGLDLARSFMVGDRITDVAAGAAAGCRTILVHSGRHTDPPIVTVDQLPSDLEPDHTAADLSGATDWILGAELS